MKKVLFLAAGLLLCLSVSAQQFIADFQKKYEKDAEFTIVNITSKMFQLIGSMATTEEQSIIKDLDGLRVITTEKNAEKHYKNAMKMVNSWDYEELMSMEESTEKMRMFTQEKDGLISSLIIVTIDGKEFSLIGISGNIDLKKVASLSKTLNIDKLDKLDEIPEK
ncbi:MAG: DUF4252 domain-containing protein [Bacteroides sp.]|nr:DUF4252 domain-containing protein [Bacteroides sp.]